MVFSPQFSQRLPETYALVEAANLVVHPAVSRIVLHGSRGPAGGARPDSDLDLSLLVALPAGLGAASRDSILRAAFETTFRAWQAEIDLDLAVVFDTRGCGLRCFAESRWRDGLCVIGGRDCFGLYKLREGVPGPVTHGGVEVRRMYPCLEIWRRPSEERPL